jgi:hypothetical protein
VTGDARDRKMWCKHNSTDILPQETQLNEEIMR